LIALQGTMFVSIFVAALSMFSWWRPIHLKAVMFFEIILVFLVLFLYCHIGRMLFESLWSVNTLAWFIYFSCKNKSRLFWWKKVYLTNYNLHYELLFVAHYFYDPD
jgi:hypothetical protein